MKFDLSDEVRKISNKALKELSKSLWELPEYYLNVKLAESAKKQGYFFELEKSTREIEKELNVELPKATRNGRIDLVIRTPKQKKLTHLIEIKTRLGFGKVLKDVLRLAEFCSASNKKSVQKAFLVVVTRASCESIKKRKERLQKELDLHFQGRRKIVTIALKKVIPIAEYYNHGREVNWKDEHVVILQITAKS
jgi:hypothetical protein